MREYDRDRERAPRDEDERPAPRSSGERRGKKKKKKNPVTGHIFRAFAALICLGIIAGCVVACYLTVYAFDMLEDEQYILDLDAKKLEYTTFMYAQDPETQEWVELQRLSAENGNRIWVDYDQLPNSLLKTLVAVEDKRFWDHNGVDWVTTIKATINLVGHKFHVPFLTFYEGTPGASTITQQVTRNLTDDKEVDVMRKAREIVRALKLERRYSKDQIIESYLNLVSFGNNTYGIQAAANLYFNKDVSELTIAESASIVGITKDPTYYNPFYNTEKNKGLENNLKRKDDILFLMHEQGMLTDEEYETELDRELVFASDNKEKMVSYDQSYFVDYAIECVINDLAAQQGCTYREAESMILSGGYRIYTTVDTRVQELLDEVYETYEFPTVKNEEKPQSAFVITEPNGRIVALRGGTGVKEGARVWNRATDTTRQAGSTIKPITSYALAVQQNLVNFSTLIEDKKVVIKQDEGQPDWEPGNFYGNFKGFMTVTEAIQRSCNMVPVQLVQMLTPRACWNFLHDTLNVQSLSEMDIAYSPMALGSLTNGITPLDMAGAYQMYANGGMRTQPYCYTRVLDSRGKVVLENRQAPQRVLDYDTATVMNKLLQRVVNAAPGTGTAASLGGSIPVAGKTGTTDDDVDQWFVGLTPYYVGVCWVGYDEQFQRDDEGNLLYDGYGRKIPNTVRYTQYPPPLLWKEVMSRVHEGLEAKDFAGSSSVISLKFCTLTGYAATPDCENTIVGWYKNENIPSACPYHTGLNPDVPLVGQKSPEPEEDFFPEDDFYPDDD